MGIEQARCLTLEKWQLDNFCCERKVYFEKSIFWKLYVIYLQKNEQNQSNSELFQEVDQKLFAAGRRRSLFQVSFIILTVFETLFLTNTDRRRLSGVEVINLMKYS